MKKIYFLILTLLICNFLSAQTESQRTEISKSSDKSANEIFIKERQNYDSENYAKALKIASEKGISTSGVQANGEFYELIGLSDAGDLMFYSTNNFEAAATTRVNKLWTGGGLGLNLNGENMIAGEWDGGAVLATHQEFAGRVMQKDNATTTNDHSTHVAGTIIAAGVDNKAKGMANKATLWANEWMSDIIEMTKQAGQGLLVSNHSYGTICGWNYNGTSYTWYGSTSISPTEDYKFGYYSTVCKDWDKVAFNNPYYLPLKSAGNERSNGPVDAGTNGKPNLDGGKFGYDCVGDVGNAKNILTVGAIYPLINGYTKPSDVKISSFSSFGPTDDGRIKPDVVANGVDVYSCANTGTSDYTIKNGTSMATPNATGSLLLLQQHYSNLNLGSFMKASTLKALTIHTADEAGNVGPDYQFGWGLINVEKAVKVISSRNKTSFIKEETLANGGTYTFNVNATGLEPLIATIVWADPAGTSPTSVLNNRTPILVNNLDLKIKQNLTVFYPWTLDYLNPSYNAVRNQENNLDNVEQVKIDVPVAGVYTIEVKHKGTLAASQSFSIIITGVSAATKEIEVADISTTTTYNNYSNATPFSIKINNNGSLAQSNLSVYYELKKISDNSVVISSSYVISALAKYSSNITTLNLDLSKYDTYSLKVWTNLIGDEVVLNNSLTKNFKNNCADLSVLGSIYTQNFETANSIDDISYTYSSINGTTDYANNFWWDIKYAKGESYEGVKYIRHQFGEKTSNDWLFSNCFILKKGITYAISFYYKQGADTEKFKFALGTTPNSLAMTTILMDLATLKPSTNYTLISKTFTVPADGKYYFGWNIYSGITTDVFCIDNIKVETSTTLQILPTVTTTTATSITNTTATSGGNVTAQGTSAITERGIVFSTTTNPLIGGVGVVKQSFTTAGIGAYSINMTGLLAGTKYYVKAFATSNAGTAYGSEIIFTTTGVALVKPTATIAAATNITTAGATLNGSANANGNVTSITFEYGLTTNYGSSIVATPSSLSGSTTTNVSAIITGLTQYTVYNYRIKAVSQAGTTYSSNQTFTTTALSTNYCTIKGNSVIYEWIDLVKLGNINRISTADAGYINVTSPTTNLVPGTTYTINFSAGFKSTAYTEYWNIWIDYNNNKTFETTESIVSSYSSKLATTLTKSFTVPATATLGNTRMRVVMSNTSKIVNCGTFSYGEVEDYTVNISTTAKTNSTDENFEAESLLTNVQIYPNPANNLINVVLTNYENSEIIIYNTLGIKVLKEELSTSNQEINIENLPTGLYLIKIKNGNYIISEKLIKQ